MSKIPDAVSMLSTTGWRKNSDPAVANLNKLLVAALLRLQQENEEAALIITEAELRKADHYSLITTVIAEDNAVVLTVRPKP